MVPRPDEARENGGPFHAGWWSQSTSRNLTIMLPARVASMSPPLLNFPQSGSIALRFFIAERVLYAFTVATEINGIQDGERASDAPQEPDAKADKRGRTEGDHRANLVSAASDRYRKAVLCARDCVIESVALHGYPARFRNQAAEFFARHALGRGGAGVVVDLLFDDSAVQVIGPETQRNLRDLGRHHLPVRLDVGEVIQQQP